MPTAPLVPFILADAALLHRLHDEGAKGHEGSINGIDRLAAAVGFNLRSLVRYAKGEADWISFDKADRYCCATGRHLRDVWPWLYTPEQVAADLNAVENENPAARAKRLGDRARTRARRIQPSEEAAS